MTTDSPECLAKCPFGNFPPREKMGKWPELIIHVEAWDSAHEEGVGSALSGAWKGDNTVPSSEGCNVRTTGESVTPHVGVINAFSLTKSEEVNDSSPCSAYVDAKHTSALG